MKTVCYSAVTIGPIAVGSRVELITINHPGYKELKGTSLQVVNGLPVFTTPIQKIYPDGTTFDTMNTHYVFYHISDDGVASNVPNIICHEDKDNAMVGDSHRQVHGAP